MVYIPPVIIDELEDIRREDQIDSRVEAFRKLAKYSRVGREAKRLVNFGNDWSKKNKNRKDVNEFEMSSQPYEVFR